MANNGILFKTTATNEMVCTTSTTAKSSSTTTINTSRKANLATAFSVHWMNTGKQMFAGGLSGCVECCCTYPTDFVKVAQQLDERKGKNRLYRNAFDVIRHTVRNYGFLGMYRGFSVTFSFVIPKYMFRFGSYEQIKSFLIDKDGQLSSRDKLICGLGAGIVEALFAVIPQESIKVKFINDRFSPKPKYNGLIDGIKEIIKEKGLRGTYQGVWPTLIKQGSNQAIRFFVFESLKEWHDHHYPNKSKNQSLIALFGAIAGATSVLGNTPFDVVKTRMQGLESHKYKNMTDCIVKIFKKEGFLGFYKGLMPRLVKVSLEVAIAFTMYDFFSDLFKTK